MTKKLNLTLILTLLTAILTAGLYIYFYNSLAKNKLEVNKFYSESKAFKIKLNNLQNVEQNLKKTIVDGDRISSLFVRQDSIVDFIQNIEDLMKSAGVSGSVDSVAEETSPELDALGKQKLNMVISANGEWEGAVNLLGLLERLPYKSTINSFSLINTKSEEKTADKKTISKTEWRLKTGMVVWAIKNQKDSGDTAGTDDTSDENN